VDVANYFIKNRVITWMIVIIFSFGGFFAYEHLGRFEDPEYTIKEALVITHYPGATPQEVAEEVTEKLERAIQKLSQIKRIESMSAAGYSEIKVIIQDKYNKNSLPQVWDELRRKVNDTQPQLPPGTHISIVNDDYSDVFGMYYALTGEGFSYEELYEYAKHIQKQLLLVEGVAKVEIAGKQQEAIFIDIATSKLSQLGISPDEFKNILVAQNIASYAGEVRVGDEYVRISTDSNIDSIAAIRNLLVRSQTSGNLIRIGDFAEITRSYQEVPEHIIYHNGQRALTLGISNTSGSNVVKIGDAITNKLKSLQNVIPVGINVEPIYYQPTVVNQAVNGFVISLIEALLIVSFVLLIFMGIRSGLIISSILLLTVLGTLFFMYLFNIALERISLGALIIALGMLVDNAIVVVEGILVRIQQGTKSIKAAQQVLQQTLWPLFGATIIGFMAFASISLSDDSTGEYAASLFYVVMISLLLSWFLAITVAPLLCHLFLTSSSTTTPTQQTTIHQPRFYQNYKAFLQTCLTHRKLLIISLITLLVSSAIGFRYLKPGFFPDSTTPMFYFDYWRAQGTDIRAHAKDMREIATHLQSMDNVTNVTTLVGRGAQRFILVYQPEKPHSSYGQFLVRVSDYRLVDQIARQLQEYVTHNYPYAETKIRRIQLGPGKPNKIEARFSGPDVNVLRELSSQAQAIMRQHTNAVAIRDDWRNRVKVIQPAYAEAQARRTGITRTDVNTTLAAAFSGNQVGVFRDQDELIPILVRLPDAQRTDVSFIDDIPIWSPLLKKTVPIGQVISRFTTIWQDDLIHRRNRLPTITVSCDPREGPPGELFSAMRTPIEAIPLAPGYQLEWGGEYEDASDAQNALLKNLPVSFILMFIITVLLFGRIKQPLIIWLCVPFALIGVVLGLLVTNKPFEFMALLGFLSLAGMLIKNAIVLVDQIDLEIAQNKPPKQAIIDSCVERLRPVVLAAATTVLGMIPLLFDAFFVSMSITIMAGLTFATLLTLIFVPVLYAMFFRIK
jgi:multidrug efflux pump subunit AcrB